MCSEKNVRHVRQQRVYRQSRVRQCRRQMQSSAVLARSGHRNPRMSVRAGKELGTLADERGMRDYHRVKVTGLNSAVWPDPPGYHEQKTGGGGRGKAAPRTASCTPHEPKDGGRHGTRRLRNRYGKEKRER